MPDDAGGATALRILQLAETAGPDDLLLCLISGGGSALLTLPAPGLTMDDLRAVNKALLLSGAAIHEMNCVRKHLSAISGGRLAQAVKGGRVVSLMISDVPGDDLSVIASGPTVGDPTSFADARMVISKYAIAVPAAVERYLAEAKEETPKPGDPCFTRVENILIAKPQDALEAAAAFARRHGITPLVLGNAIEGEARDVALVMAGMARQTVEHGQPIAAPCVLISGGETTVSVKGEGRGRAQLRISSQFRDCRRGAFLAHSCHGLRHGRHRRHGGQCGRCPASRYARQGAGQRRQSQGLRSPQ